MGAGLEALMEVSRTPACLHANRRAGLINSICRVCQSFIATKANEIDLRQPEKDHVCGGLNMGDLLHPENAR